MLHCSTNDGTITKMHEAICSEKTFGVGFNIPQPKEVGFNQYQGSFVPEVRCGLFDLERMIKERPFPNSLKALSFLELNNLVKFARMDI